MSPAPGKLAVNDTDKIGADYIDCWSELSSMMKEDNPPDISSKFLYLFAANIPLFLDLLDRVRSNWQKSEARCHEYKAELAALEKKLATAEEDNTRLTDLLLNCQSQVKHLMKSKSGVEEQLGLYKKQLNQCKTLLKVGCCWLLRGSSR